MLAVSNSIKNAYNQYTTKRKSKIKVGNNEYFIQNMSLLADAYDEGNIVGNAIAKTLEFDIETEYVSGLDEFILYDGVWTGEQYEYINLGTFKLFEEQGADDFFSHITAYDKLILFKTEFDPNLVQFPTTIYGLLQSICSQAGVTLDTETIVNGDKTLETNLFVENETLKDILRAICQVSGTFAVISEDKLKLKLKSSDALTLSKYQLSNPQYKRTTWKINQVVLGMQDIDGEYVQKSDEEDIERNGVHKIVINNNPFTYTQELRQQYIDDLFDQLKGFGYIAFETEWEGLPYVELGDSLIIDDYESLVLRYQIKSPDGLNSMLQAPSIIDSVIDYIDNTDSLENKLRRTEYKVDKENSTITNLVQVTTTLDSRTTNNETTINNNYQELINKFNDVASIDDVTQLRQSMQTTMNEQELRIENIQGILVNGVEKVVTTSGTFDEDGLTMERTGARTKSTLDETGVDVKDTQGSSNEDLFFAGYVDNDKAQSNTKLAPYEGQTVVFSKNSIVENYFTIGTHSRIEDYEDGTGVFYIGG